jgi:hypothetical protein
MEVSGQLQAPAVLPPWKKFWYSLDRRLGGPQSRSGRCGEEKNFEHLPAVLPPIIQSVAQRYTTELTLLLLREEHIHNMHTLYRSTVHWKVFQGVKILGTTKFFEYPEQVHLTCRIHYTLKFCKENNLCYVENHMNSNNRLDTL